MREIISLHIGQAGLQLANTCWELYCLEHDIQMDGTIPSTKVLEGLNSNPECLFSVSSQGKYVPRAILIDDDPVTINAIKSCPLRSLFNSSNILQTKSFVGGVWGEAFNAILKNEFDQIVESTLRKQMEACDGLQGIKIFHGLGGGVGGGLTCKLLEKLSDELSKITKLTISILPSQSSNIIEPYNQLLSLSKLQEHSNLSIFVDNQALNKVCYETLDIDYPNFTTLNRMIAQMTSSITQSSRFQGTKFVDLMEMRMNLTPDSKNHFLHTSYAPFINIDKQNTEQINIKNITNQLFDQKYSFINYEQESIRYIANNIFIKGDCPYTEQQQTIKSLNNNQSIKFTDFDPKNFQLAISDKTPATFPNSEFAKSNKAVCVVSNSTGIRHTLKEIADKFGLLYSKRGFVHWFVGSGLEEGEFSEAAEYLNTKIKDYQGLEIEQEKEEQQQEEQQQEQEQQQQQE